MPVVNVLFLGMVAVFIPFLMWRNGKRMRELPVARGGAQAIHWRLMLLPALYLPITLATAYDNGLAWPRIDEIDGSVLLLAGAWTLAKFVIVAILKDWLRADTGAAVTRLAPAWNAGALALFALACMVIGSAEEVVFRWVFPAVLQSLGLTLALSFLIASLVFALWHAALGPRGMVFAGVAGWVNHWLVWISGSLWTTIFSHIAYDLGAGLLLAWERRQRNKKSEAAALKEVRT